jgi:oligosaccharide repeat unit polymerase
MSGTVWETNRLVTRRAILDRTLFLWAALILCGLLPLLFLYSIDNLAPVAATSVLLQWVIVLWSGLRLSAIAGAGKARPIATTFWLYVYVWLGIAGFVQLMSGRSPPSWPTPLDPRNLLVTQLVILAGLSAVELGALGAEQRRRRDTSDFPGHSVPDMQDARELGAGSQPRSSWLSGLLRRTVSGRAILWLCLYAVVTFPFWLHQLGGVNALLDSRQALSSAVYGSGDSKVLGGIIVALSTVPVFVAAYALWLGRVRNLVRRGLTGLLLCVLIGINLLINSPIAMPRFWTGTILVAIIFGTAWVRRHGGIRIVILSALIGTIVLFPYGAYFRYSTGFKPVDDVVQTIQTKSDYDSFQMVGAAVHRVNDRGHTMGEQAAGAMLFFVPRSEWPSKPTDTGAKLAGEVGLDYTNLAAPLWAETYLDFGFAGVILVFLIYGYFMRRIDDIFLRATSPFLLFAAPVIAGYSVIVLRGPLLQAMVRLFAIAFCLWFISRRSMRNQAPKQRSTAEMPSASTEKPPQRHSQHHATQPGRGVHPAAGVYERPGFG